jgi:hypothetical protein
LGDQIEKNEMGGICSTYGETGDVYRGWWGNLKERDHSEHPGLDRRILLRWIFRKWDVSAWTGSMWLSIGTGGGYL